LHRLSFLGVSQCYVRFLLLKGPWQKMSKKNYKQMKRTCKLEFNNLKKI
jgi:hypothetical protein